jgi:DNA-binding LytR/AlgR family response regulator
MMRALVIDDEEWARRHLVAMLGDDVRVVAEASSGTEALEKIDEFAPDVIFLDIEMPEMNGFEMLARLPEPPAVVFVTAYDTHAVQAFEAQAIDYILKPLRRERVARAVERLLSRGQSPDSLKSVMRQVPAIAKIVGKRGRRFVLLPLPDVVRIAVEDRLVFAHTVSDRFLVNRTLADLEPALTPHGFFRVSRTDIVNLQYAREFIPRSSGTWQLTLSNGEEVTVSRERGRELRIAMNF